MAEYKSYNISFSTTLENGSAVSKVYISDDETEFEDVIEYELSLEDIDKFGGKYIDNIAEFLLDKGDKALIEQRKEYRKNILNIYDEDDDI